MSTGNEMPSDLAHEIHIINHGIDAWVPYKDERGRECICVKDKDEPLPVTTEDEENDGDE